MPIEDFWILLGDIPVGSILTLQTETYRYDFKVLEGDSGEVEVLSNHDLFLRERRVHIIGSWTSPKTIKIRSFAIGYEVQIQTKGGHIWVTEPLQGLQVNGRQDLPIPSRIN